MRLALGGPCQSPVAGLLSKALSPCLSDSGHGLLHDPLPAHPPDWEEVRCLSVWREPQPPRGHCQGRRFELCVACPHSRLLSPAHRPSRPPHPPRLSLLGVQGQGGGGAQTLGCWGAWVPASVYLPKKTGWARGRAPGDPALMRACPALPHTDTVPSRVGVQQALPPGRDCPAEAILQARGRDHLWPRPRGEPCPGFLYLTV